MVDLAYILAKEISYRSRRKWKRGTLINREVKPSIIHSNILLIIILTFFSIPLAAMLALAPQKEVENAYLSGSTAIIGFSGIFTLMITVSFTATFTSEQIIEMLHLLPLSEEKLTKTYFKALLFYWGGLSIFTPVIPLLASSIYRIIRNELPPLNALTLLSSFVTAVLTIFFIGISLGTYATRIRRNIVMRVLSTFGWLAVFLIWILVQRLMNIGFIRDVLGGTLEKNRWIALIPYFGPLLWYRYPLISTISFILSVLLMGATVRIALKSFRKIIFPQPTISVETHVSEIKVRPIAYSYLLKDLRLLSREPRRLATILYNLILPFLLFLNPFQRNSLFMITLSSCITGVIVSSTIPKIYYVEGSSAPFLYVLPLTRRKLAAIKTIPLIPFSIVASIILGVGTFIFTQNIWFSLYALILETAVSLTLAYSLSNIMALMLPETPSQWTEATISNIEISLITLALTAVTVAVALAVIAITGNPYITVIASATPSIIIAMITIYKLDYKTI